MQRLIIELEKSFDGRDSQWSGLQLFERGGRRFGYFTFHLWDKDRTVKHSQFILPLKPIGTRQIHYM